MVGNIFQSWDKYLLLEIFICCKYFPSHSNKLKTSCIHLHDNSLFANSLLLEPYSLYPMYLVYSEKWKSYFVFVVVFFWGGDF